MSPKEFGMLLLLVVIKVERPDLSTLLLRIHIFYPKILRVPKERQNRSDIWTTTNWKLSEKQQSKPRQSL